MSNPRSLFYANADLQKWHKALIHSDNFDTAVTYALAEYGRQAPGTEKMLGVMDFLLVFRDLSTKPETPPPLIGPKLVPWEELGKRDSTKPK